MVANNLQPDEDVLMTFIGLHNYISPTNHNDNCAFAITNKRILIGKKKLVGEFFQIVQLNMLNDITMNSGFVYGTITFDTMKEKFNVLVDKAEANSILQKIHEVIYGSKGIQNQANNFSELVQLKLDIETLVGDSTPTKVGNGTPTYRSGSLEIG